ncbi:hypothetical protein [Streptococcus sp. NLN76]|uniref:hypothetical protein n=1 Tax=Streptococcus sp. NLN76 TaxID=2822800 RepID=UPI0018AC20BB|nr:hypothetical protein [Streptococcus sp. NLN76]MBF8970557.1 hypothetical protein [Streptococcus sp. NLN76]
MKILLYKSMAFHYLISIFIDISLICYFLIKNDSHGFIFTYLIISLFYYFFNYKDFKEEFDTFFSTVNEFKQGFRTSFLIYPLILLKFSMGIWLVNDASNILKTVILVLFIVKFSVSLTGLPFVTLLLTSTIPIVVSSLVGIDKAPINWTLMSLFLIDFLFDFFGIDLINSITDKQLRKVNKNLESDIIQPEITRFKFNFIIFTISLYISLWIFDLFIQDQPFQNFIDKNLSIDVSQVKYLSVENFYLSFFKLFIMISVTAIFFEYRTKILKTITVFFLKSTGGKLPPYSMYGKYVLYQKVRKCNIGRDENVWKADYSNYYWCLNNSFQNQSGEYFYCENGQLHFFGKKENNQFIEKKKVYPVKFITNEIMKIDYDYYIKENSDSFTKLNQSDRQESNELLHRSDHSVWFGIVLLFIFYIIIHF